MLVYKDLGTTGTQLEIWAGDIPVGFIRKRLMAKEDAFQWGFGFHSAVPKGFVSGGFVDTIAEAKLKVEANWRLWVEASGLTKTV